MLCPLKEPEFILKNFMHTTLTKPRALNTEKIAREYHNSKTKLGEGGIETK